MGFCRRNRENCLQNGFMWMYKRNKLFVVNMFQLVE